MMAGRKVKIRTLCSNPQRDAAPKIVRAVYVCDTRLAGLREKKTEVARTQLKELVVEFPEDPLFASELAKLKVPSAAAIPTRRMNSYCAERASVAAAVRLGVSNRTERPDANRVSTITQEGDQYH